MSTVTPTDFNLVIPGDYQVDVHAYRVEAAADGIRVRYVRRNGTPAPGVLGHVTGDGTGIQVTGNGSGHAGRLRALAAVPGRYRTAVRCEAPGCGRVLTDPESIRRRRGPEHRGAA